MASRKPAAPKKQKSLPKTLSSEFLCCSGVALSDVVLKQIRQESTIAIQLQGFTQDVAEDAAQEAVTALFENQASLLPQPLWKLQTWANRVARCRAIDHVRMRGRHGAHRERVWRSKGHQDECLTTTDELVVKQQRRAALAAARALYQKLADKGKLGKFATEALVAIDLSIRERVSRRVAARRTWPPPESADEAAVERAVNAGVKRIEKALGHLAACVGTVMRRKAQGLPP